VPGNKLKVEKVPVILEPDDFEGCNEGASGNVDHGGEMGVGSGEIRRDSDVGTVDLLDIGDVQFDWDQSVELRRQ
jgi:hypothetical protein